MNEMEWRLQNSSKKIDSLCCCETCPFDLQHGKCIQLGLHPETITVALGYKQDFLNVIFSVFQLKISLPQITMEYLAKNFLQKIILQQRDRHNGDSKTMVRRDKDAKYTCRSYMNRNENSTLIH